MNWIEWARLIKLFESNRWINNVVLQIARSRAVLDEIDLVKTRVWWLLSKDFEKTKNPEEIKAFFHFLISNLLSIDFNKPIQNIINTINSQLKKSDWFMLELIITEVLMRIWLTNQIISTQKWTRELDKVYKTDMITSYKCNGVNCIFWVQITTTSRESGIIKKEKDVARIIPSLSESYLRKLYNSDMQLDSMVLVQLNWIFSSSLHNDENLLKKALIEWEKWWFKWNITDFISNEKLAWEILRFCRLYTSIFWNFLNITISGAYKNLPENSTIELKNWERIRLTYSEKDKTIKYSFYINDDDNKFLFSIKFTLNNKLMNKIRNKPKVIPYKNPEVNWWKKSIKKDVNKKGKHWRKQR